MSRFVVVGTGRCGTTWASEVLAACGLRVAHQAIRHAHVLGEPFEWGELDGVVSYEAVPLLGTLDVDRTVLLVRDPLAVAASWLSFGAFVDMAGFADLAAVLDRHAPQVLAQPSPLGRALEFWLAWNALALPHVTAVRWANGVSVDTLAADVGHPWCAGEAARAVPRTLNHRRADKVANVHVGWHDVDPDRRGRLRAMVDRLRTLALP